jgi:prephenate dehydrogenase
MANNDKSNMTIIGGTRGLGKWLAEHLKSNFNIRITSRDASTGKPVAEEIGVGYSDNNIEAIRDADIVVFSVPIEYMVDTIKEVAPHAPEGSLLMDVASVKTEPADALEKYAPENAEILPCHPMFGPRVPTLKRQIIVLTPIDNRSDKWLPRVKDFLDKSECEVVLTTPNEHDKYMSIVQGLTHFSYISLASTIRKLNINVKKSRNFSSPVYTIMLDMVSRIVYQNPYLYYSIQKNNLETSNAREALIKESIYLSNLIEEGKEDDFVKSMVESAKHLDGYEDALARSDKAISMLTQKSNVLSKSIGKEVGLKHQHSENVHLGIVKEVTAKSVMIETADNTETCLKLSNVDILSENEIYEWKKNNFKLEQFDLSVVFPSKSDEKHLIEMFKNIEPVIDVEIVDVYNGEQIDDSQTSYTFHYTLFNSEDRDYVEEFIEGIGGTIR